VTRFARQEMQFVGKIDLSNESVGPTKVTET